MDVERNAKAANAQEVLMTVLRICKATIQNAVTGGGTHHPLPSFFGQGSRADKI